MLGNFEVVVKGASFLALERGGRGSGDPSVNNMGEEERKKLASRVGEIAISDMRAINWRLLCIAV